MDVKNSTSASLAISAFKNTQNAQQSQQTQQTQQLQRQQEQQPKPRAVEDNSGRESAVVTLSARARALSEADGQNNGRNEQNSVQAARQPAGIEFISGERKGGKVNAYA